MYGNETSSVALVSWKRAAVSAEPSWSVIVSFVYSVLVRRILFSQFARNFDTKSAFWKWREENWRVAEEEKCAFPDHFIHINYTYVSTICIHL